MSSLNAVLTNFLKILQASSSSMLVNCLLGSLALLPLLVNEGWPRNYKVKDGDTFHFIVVGSGSAGAIIARRLSEAPHVRVLLIEAGGDPPPNSVLAFLFPTLANTEYDWAYPGHYDKGVGSARVKQGISLSRGKVLGGCSSTNYLVYSRGVPRDYDDWSLVAPGWSWPEVLPYFKKFENNTDPSVFSRPHNAELHSTDGPVKVSRPEDNVVYAEINKERLKSYREINIPTVLENNGPEIFGAARPHFTFWEGKRSSTAEAYLRNVEGIPNLYVATHTRAIRLLIDRSNMQAYGVEVINSDGEIVRALAETEVIVSAGTIDSAKLLMLSGIGPQEDLVKLGIEPLLNLPVGQNMQDHPFVPLSFAGRKGFSSAFTNLIAPIQLAKFPVPFQSSFFRLDYIDSSDPIDRPQFQTFNIYIGAAASLLVYFGCSSYGFKEELCKSLAEHNNFRELDMTSLLLLHEKSRGSVRLRSNNALDDPIIEMGYFRDSEDLFMMVEAIKYISNFGNTSYYRDAGGYLVHTTVPGCEGIPWATDEFWQCYAKATVGSMLHPVGTCKMGADGVVDERLKVHGISNLRVADASIMPEISSGNTNAAAMMIGEKASDLIKEDHGIVTRYWYN